uniref:Uncharacterized protein n=1 Tax=Anguilla anguilla TaxID=7936 RepID=A0A0E9WZU4_ANGAN
MYKMGFCLKSKLEKILLQCMCKQRPLLSYICKGSGGEGKQITLFSRERVVVY